MAKTHLVGSMRIDDAETVYRTVVEQCGDAVSRIPDGETGPRANWIFSMIPRLRAAEGLVELETVDVGYTTIPKFGIAAGSAAADVKFDLGYDTDGIANWPTFKRLKDEGVIGRDVKFQLAIPTAMAIIGNYIRDLADQVALMPVYEGRLQQEIANITKRIPAEELSIQWDVAVEFGLMEGAFGVQVPEPIVIDQIVRMSRLVPQDVEMGYHLCYGDAPAEPGAKGRHFKEPEDTALMTKVAKAIVEGASHPVAYIHLPVPIERDDDAYFKPLEELDVPSETELYLGLVHDEDGLEGAQRRAATAAKHVKGPFGVGTECGMGNEPTDRIPELLKLHTEIEVPA